MMKWRILAGLLAGVLAFLISGYVYVLPQPGTGSTEAFDEIVAELVARVEGWRSEARLIIGLTVAVAIFGAMAAVPQKFGGDWYKRMALYAGVSVTALTVINMTVFDVDHRLLRRMVNEACCRLSEIRICCLSYAGADPSDREFIAEEIRRLVREVHEIEERRYKQVGGGFDLVPAAYAGDMPQWITSPPEDTRNVYFVGIGDDTGLANAKNESYENAVEQAREYLAIQFGRSYEDRDSTLDVEALTRYIIESAEVAGTHFTISTERRLCRYYTLLRLGKDAAGTDLKMFAAQHDIAVPKKLASAIKKAERTSGDYTSRRQIIYENILDSTRRTYPPAAVAQLNEARRLRKTGQVDSAIATLNGLIEQHPDIYLGLFNLALAHDAVGDSTLACAYYDRACEAEKSLVVRDASVYDAYGDFSYRCGDYDKAVRLLEAALEIDPEHPGAAKMLAAARVRRGP